jgi:septal ring factor EnvC (AmiA/AmiB activator)
MTMHRIPLFVFLATLFLGGLSHAESPDSAHMNALQIGKLRFGINNQELMLEQSEQQEQTLIAELSRLNGEMAEHQQKIDALKTKISDQERTLAAKEQEMVSILHQNEALRGHLIKRLKTYYIMGRAGFLNITFSGKTLPEMVLTQDALASLVIYDQDLFKEYRGSITELERIKDAKILEKSVLEHFLADADAANQALKETASEKNELLKRVQAQKGLHEAALREMRKAESELRETMQEPTPPPPTSNTSGIVQAKGQLPPPLWGEVTRRFQQTDRNDDTTFANGITIKTLPRSEVFSIFSGTVLFAGPMRGYGNMVIIDHHQHYYSVNARLGDIHVQPGTIIGQGQVIGTTSDRSQSREGDFYFEIRHDAVAEDPLLWLRPGSLALP